MAIVKGKDASSVPVHRKTRVKGATRSPVIGGNNMGGSGMPRMGGTAPWGGMHPHGKRC